MRQWIVLPFANTTRAADLDWLSSASVHLLSVDMLNWTDLRVEPKERVTHLLPNAPESRQAQLSSQDGLSIAR